VQVVDGLLRFEHCRLALEVADLDRTDQLRQRRVGELVERVVGGEEIADL
jgi:hypothetical protein